MLGSLRVRTEALKMTARALDTNSTPAFPTGHAKRSTNEASASVARKVTMIVDLLTQRQVRFSDYARTYDRDYRSFQRDLQQLRTIGKDAGFSIAPIKGREIAALTTVDAKKRALNRGPKRIEILTATIARALGEPMARELGTEPQTALPDDDFYLIATPTLAQGTAVSDMCQTLREAHAGPNGRAFVRFTYPSGETKVAKERLVEPYRIAVRSGCYYLIGYDRGSKGWRTFALDRFRSNVVKAGSCTIARELPPEYASRDVIGFMKSIGTRIDVTVELSPQVAASASARVWQADQRIEHLAGGRTQMTFVVADVTEVVRWAMGFGADAKIVAPPKAVEAALVMAKRIASAYDEPISP